MDLDEKTRSALERLIDEGGEIHKLGFKRSSFIKDSHFDVEKSVSWYTKSINLLARVFRPESEHYQNLKSLDENIWLVTSSQRALGVLRAAKEDYENGFLFKTRRLIEAEIFDDFLDQSEHLLNQGYFTAAAVIAGSTLEDALRKLCDENEIPVSARPKLDTMNSDLAKAGVYNLLKQKQITALADLRNKAAHGLGGYTREDVESMTNAVRKFLEDHFN